MQNERLFTFVLDEDLDNFVNAINMYGSESMQGDGSIIRLVRMALAAVKRTTASLPRHAVDRFYNYSSGELSNYYSDEVDFERTLKEINDAWIRLVDELRTNFNSHIDLEDERLFLSLLTVDLKTSTIVVNVYEETSDDNCW